MRAAAQHYKNEIADYANTLALARAHIGEQALARCGAVAGVLPGRASKLGVGASFCADPAADDGI